MICHMCGTSEWMPVHNYTEPDKYEQWVGLKDIQRGWFQCGKCRFFQAWRNYNLSDLEVIYRDGYRDEKFRDETIDTAFERVCAIPTGNSENYARIQWFLGHAEPKMSATLLDIGSGLGIWPYKVVEQGLDVSCVEINRDSRSFISNELNLVCYRTIPDCFRYDYVSIIHVLEHLPDPENLLRQLKKSMFEDGKLFIEVPDSIEFEYLDKDHDEFNSCHIHFYDSSNLIRLVEFCGYRVTDVHRVYKNSRGLSRILMLAEA